MKTISTWKLHKSFRTNIQRNVIIIKWYQNLPYKTATLLLLNSNSRQISRDEQNFTGKLYKWEFKVVCLNDKSNCWDVRANNWNSLHKCGIDYWFSNSGKSSQGFLILWDWKNIICGKCVKEFWGCVRNLWKYVKLNLCYILEQSTLVSFHKRFQVVTWNVRSKCVIII